MRKAFLLLMILGVGLFVLNHRREHRHDDDTYLQQLEHMLECTDWQVYEDSSYGYAIRYPSCFLPASAEGEVDARFVYVEQMPLREITYISLEASTQVCRDSLNPYRDMQRIAEAVNGVCLRKSDTEFLMTARVKSRDTRITAFRLNAKYVLCQRLWFVETLIYPEDFAPAVQRLVHEVDEWKPFEE